MYVYSTPLHNRDNLIRVTAPIGLSDIKQPINYDIFTHVIPDKQTNKRYILKLQFIHVITIIAHQFANNWYELEFTR